MYMPVIRGIIERRILINYRVDPQLLERLLPPPFRPQLVNGYGLGGICLIRLNHMRPRMAPAWLGVRSENAAHRVAVQWDEAAEVRSGVFVMRRESDSHINVLAGGRLFPGQHQRAEFSVQESGNHYSVQVSGGSVRLTFAGRLASHLPTSSVFRSIEDASAFFARGALGYSPARVAGTFDALELQSDTWNVEPLEMTALQSSFFDDQSRFPGEAVQFDCALLMRNIPHHWHAHPSLCCPATVGHEHASV